MPHGYGFWTFGWLQAEREFARVDKFKERGQRLTEIINLLIQHFMRPLGEEGVISDSERAKLMEINSEIQDWLDFLQNNLDMARQRHLGSLAVAIKKAALMSIGLCQKYNRFPGIKSYSYDSSRKMIVVNDKNLFYLG